MFIDITPLQVKYIKSIITKSYKHQIDRINLIEDSLKIVCRPESEFFFLPENIISKLSDIVLKYSSKTFLILSFNEIQEIISDFFLFFELEWKTSNSFINNFLTINKSLLNHCSDRNYLSIYYFSDNFLFVRNNLRKKAYKIRNVHLIIWFLNKSNFNFYYKFFDFIFYHFLDK
jgi:hypothetical protein